MKRKPISATTEKLLLRNYVEEKSFLGASYSTLSRERLNGTFSKLPLFDLVVSWCLTHYDLTKEAPKKALKAIASTWCEENDDNEISDLVEDFVEVVLDSTFEPVSLNFLLDKQHELFTRLKLNNLQQRIEAALSLGQIQEADELVTSYKSLTVGLGSAVDVLNDQEVWSRVFSDTNEPLITFPGDAGKFFNSALVRDSLVGIQAPEKRGKTWWCLEFAVRAMRNRKKVAFFEVGDSSESQILKRFAVRIGEMTLGPMKGVKIPMKIVKDEEDKKKYTVQTKTLEGVQAVTEPRARKAMKRFLRANGMLAGEKYLQLSVHSNSSINVKGIGSILDKWELEDGFIPDVVIIDYADILAPENQRSQGRDIVNDTWKALRKLSQDKHCLVIVPTQADSQSYTAEIQTMKNFSEDKRKFSHVTGMFALNQTNEEKAIQAMRLNWIVLRESPFSVGQCLYVGNCFALGRALCCSSF